MRRINIALLTLLAVASIAVVAVWAASPHYKKGPSAVDNGITATATGTIAGLGNGNLIVTLDFPNATGSTTCSNKQGNESPGQNSATPAAVSGSILITNIKGGSVSFAVTTDPPADPTSADAGCPKGKWTAAFDNVTFGNGTLTIQQDQGGGNFVIILASGVIIAD